MTDSEQEVLLTKLTNIQQSQVSSFAYTYLITSYQ